MKILKEPLLHFLLLGLALFLFFHLIDPGRQNRPDRIFVSASKIENLAEMFRRTWQRPPTSQELEELIQEQIREEIFYREALKLELDRDDTIIRRRLRQKMEFLTEDSSPLSQPTDGELEAYLRSYPEGFRSEARFTFLQVYLNPDQHGSNLKKDAQALIVKLNPSGEKAGVAVQGDLLPLPSHYENATFSEVAKDFGEEFAASLLKLKPGKWEGPLKSGYGAHWVFLKERAEGQNPPLSEIKGKVRDEWELSRRKKAMEEAFQTLRRRYEVTVERPEKIKNDGAVAAELTR